MSTKKSSKSKPPVTQVSSDEEEDLSVLNVGNGLQVALGVPIIPDWARYSHQVFRDADIAARFWGEVIQFQGTGDPPDKGHS